VEEVAVFLEVISASTPKHTTDKKSHCEEWLFNLLSVKSFPLNSQNRIAD
jgi:hypothetical protein